MPICEHKKFYFLHIHKAGGSLFCESAKRIMHVNEKDNCNIYFSTDKSIPGNQREYCCGKTKAEQQLYAINTPYDLIANEGYMNDVMDTECYEYVTILREPRQRAISHYLFARDLFFHEALGSFKYWVTHQPDNYYVRTICGETCRDIPRGQLTRYHVEYAKKRLEKFSTIIILDNLELSSRHSPIKMSSTRINGHKSNDKSMLMKQVHGREYDSLFMYDHEIYEYARYLNAKQNTKIDKDVYNMFECGNPCCGECSEY
jgi:hypothetical protein